MDWSHLNRLKAEAILGLTVIGALVTTVGTLLGLFLKEIRRYKLLSSVYRLCAFLAWIELYRQEIVFLESGEETSTQRLTKAIYAVRADLADGFNDAADWPAWRDVLLFREEQRAIGEAMISFKGESRIVIGYGEFVDMIDSNTPAEKVRWIKLAAQFLMNPAPEKDFRLIRMKRLIVHLVDLVELLAPGRLREEHVRGRALYLGLVDASLD
jgi:hypothetical protein